MLSNDPDASGTVERNGSVKMGSMEIEERKKRIDDEIKRRIEETKNSDVSNCVSPMKPEEPQFSDTVKDLKENNPRFKYSPLSTEKSRTTEMRQRLNLEKRLRDEKINKYNELLERYKKKP